MIPLPRDGWPVVRASRAAGLEPDAPPPAGNPDRPALSDDFMSGDIADMVGNIDRTVREMGR